MKTNKASLTGQRPIFTVPPFIVPGGFNLDVASQNYNVGDIIPAGSLAIFDEQTRLVNIIKTAKVVSVDSTHVTLLVDEFFAPIFAVGDTVAKAGTPATTATITKITKTDSKYVVTLDKAITGLAADDILEAVKDGKELGKANAVTISDTFVSDAETGIDVTADTGGGALLARRVPAIPDSQKADGGLYLSANVHVKLSQSY